jgi:hypothetical protein
MDAHPFSVRAQHMPTAMEVLSLRQFPAEPARSPTPAPNHTLILLHGMNDDNTIWIAPHQHRAVSQGIAPRRRDACGRRMVYRYGILQKLLHFITENCPGSAGRCSLTRTAGNTTSRAFDGDTARRKRPARARNLCRRRVLPVRLITARATTTSPFSAGKHLWEKARLTGQRQRPVRRAGRLCRKRKPSPTLYSGRNRGYSL